MESIQLGNNGPTVPRLGIGAWSWGDTLFWNYGKDYGATQVQEAFHAAVKAGITFFDTAEVYGLGKSEQLLGQFIQETETPVQIATKYGPLPWRFTADSVAEALTASLDRLQVTQVALYQVHWPFTFLMSQETLMNALADEVERGRVQTVGVSNYSAIQMREAHAILSKRGIPLAVNQVRYSLLSRQVETQGIIKTAQELGITILAYSPLSQGLLTGKYTPQNPPPSGPRQWDSKFKPEGLRQISPLLDLLRQLGQNYGKTPAQVALNWLIAQGGVIPIPGAKTAEQSRQNAGALGWQLTGDEVAQLEQVTRPWL